MINVLLVDDHKMVRQALKQVLEETSDIIVSDEASTASEALNMIWRNDYNVIVLDISMPGRSGLDVLKQLKSANHAANVLVLSMHSEEQYALRAIRNGASGYLSKDAATPELINAIQKISSGGKYFSPSVTERLIVDLGSGLDSLPHERLSDREYQIMCMISSGKTVKTIANELSLSVSTVSTNRARILQKMNMKTNAEITHYAIKGGLIE